MVETQSPPQPIEPDGRWLNERWQQVLGIVVQEYVQTAQPIGSKTIADKYDIGVSAATIRNDLAGLERAGLLTHPHTSAGRVPTEQGYRYFVRYLLADRDLSRSERLTIRHQFHQARQELDQWLRLSTAVLATASHSAALATSLQAHQSRFKHMELIAIQDATVLLVLVLQEGAVKQQLLTLNEPLSQDELSRISNELNAHLTGADILAIQQRQEGLTPLARQVSGLVADIMQRMDVRSGDQIYRNGLAQVLAAPEFAEGENVRRIVEVFEQRANLEEVLSACNGIADVQVFISGEGRYHQLADISLILSRYGVDGQATGVLGIVGPVRMPYGHNISVVRFVATLMSELVEDIYGISNNLRTIDMQSDTDRYS